MCAKCQWKLIETICLVTIAALLLIAFVVILVKCCLSRRDRDGGVSTSTVEEQCLNSEDVEVKTMSVAV